MSARSSIEAKSLLAVVGLSVGVASPLKSYSSADATAVEEPISAARTPAIPQPRHASESPTFESSDEALAHDLRLIAEVRGWTLEQAYRHDAATAEVGRLAGKVSESYPDQFIGSSVPKDPALPPVRHLKGPANEEIRQWVRGAALPVELNDNQPYSFDELEQRKRRVHDAVLEAGYKTIAAYFYLADKGEIHLEITSEPGLPRDERDVRDLLPEDLREAVVIDVRGEPVVVDEAAGGGMRMRDSASTYVCTSGWTVKHPGSGEFGVTTAGHCNSIDQIVEPQVQTYSTLFEGQHRGEWGDVEWHTTATGELAVFFADANTSREVNATEPRSLISEGETICGYGRSSNSRSCMSVEDVSAECTNSGVSNDRLVIMDDNLLIGGDSGGGWSRGNIAFGGHKGNCSDTDSFSVADLFGEALGVTVQTK